MTQSTWCPTWQGYIRLVAVWLGICVVLLGILWQVTERLSAPYQTYRPMVEAMQQTGK